MKLKFTFICSILAILMLTKAEVDMLAALPPEFGAIVNESN
jgi:hypothetical protein